MAKSSRILWLFISVVVATLALTFGTAGAQDNGADDAYVGATTIVNSSVAPSPLVESETQARVEGESLAFTGSDIAGLALIGGLAAALGFVVLTTRRRATRPV